jgi:hypothetical protein
MFEKFSGVWIMAYTAIDNPELYFQTKTYSGTGSSQSITLDGDEDMQPDWLWIKRRDSTANHRTVDSVRGVTEGLNPNQNIVEGTLSDSVTSFDSDGFSLGAGSQGYTNTSGGTFVAWCWKAGTSFSNDASATSVGSIDSSGSTSTTAGFSIVKIDSMPASTTSTFAHNLGVKPNFIIFKSRDLTTNWDVYHSSALPDGERKLYLNDTDAVIDSGFMNDTAPTSSVVSFNPGSSDSNHITYCFAEKQGFSKFGSYTGNGNADGTFVYTGFKPAFVIYKRTDSGADWHMYDNKRDPINEMDSCLFPSGNYVDQAGDDLDFLSNGFKQRSTGAEANNSGGTYIYMAFAEAPFVNSNGVPCNAR